MGTTPTRPEKPVGSKSMNHDGLKDWWNNPPIPQKYQHQITLAHWNDGALIEMELPFAYGLNTSFVDTDIAIPHLKPKQAETNANDRKYPHLWFFRTYVQNANAQMLRHTNEQYINNPRIENPNNILDVTPELYTVPVIFFPLLQHRQLPSIQGKALSFFQNPVVSGDDIFYDAVDFTITASNNLISNPVITAANAVPANTFYTAIVAGQATSTIINSILSAASGLIENTFKKQGANYANYQVCEGFYLTTQFQLIQARWILHVHQTRKRPSFLYRYRPMDTAPNHSSFQASPSTSAGLTTL